MIAEDGEFLMDQVWLDNFKSEWIMTPIPAGHEIIGVYGSLDSGDKEAYIQSLGFIVWVPNPNAKVSNPYAAVDDQQD